MAQFSRGAVAPIKRLTDFLAFRWATRGGRYTIPENPAFTPATDRWFRETIADTAFYLEFGTGASTRLAQEAGCRVIAVESDPRWLAALRATLTESSSVELFYADIGIVGAWGYPIFRSPSASRLVKWRTYTLIAEREIERTGQFPDLVLIDGRFRLACALSVAALASKRGASTTILFDDYIARPAYHQVERFLGPPSMTLDRAAVFIINSGKTIAPIYPEIVSEAHFEVQ